ncbi:MAG: hypothetical protein QNJ37_07440 [Crocosphaera sp.]|nr:hypothetical protein [Crocosphaera sp.]
MQVEEIANKLISNFQKKTLTQWQPSNDLIANLHNYIALFSEEAFKPMAVINKELLFIINDRLDLNKKVYRFFIDKAAYKGFIFNYHQKLQIKNTLNYPETNLVDWYFRHIGEDYELIDILQEIENRKNKKFIDLDKYLNQDPKFNLIIASIFCSYIYYIFYEKDVHQILNQDCRKKYLNNYWQHLKYFHGLHLIMKKLLFFLIWVKKY